MCCVFGETVTDRWMVSFSSVHNPAMLGVFYLVVSILRLKGPNSTKCNVLFFAVLGKTKGLVGFYGLVYVQTIQYLSKFFISDKYHLDFVL